MTDHELLVLAARATFPPDEWREEERKGVNTVTYRHVDSITNAVYWFTWNPLEYNDEAFQLMTQHHLDVYHAQIDEGVWRCGAVGPDDTYTGGFGETIGADACTAVRRAIVRAAAEIGKEMK